MTQSNPERGSRPEVPGLSQACVTEQEARKALETTIGSIARELAAIRKDIGTSPDPTAPEEERDGSGLKGIAVRSLNKLEVLSSKVDQLTTQGASLSPGAASSLSKKLGTGLVVIFLAIQSAWTLYQTMRPTPTLIPTNTTTTQR